MYESEPPGNYHHQSHPGDNVHDGALYSNQSLADTEASESNLATASLPQLLHWSEVVYEVDNFQVDDWNVAGGSDYGQLPYLIDSGDILLEVEGQKVAGLTRNDVLELLHLKESSLIRAVSSSSSFGLPIDLREYLSRRFVRGSVDHDLQATIRDNVYLRTIPCTTRPPRPGEQDNLDYKFVSRDEFMVMERSGVLLESGIYSGHYYGTPLPLSNPATPNPANGQLNHDTASQSNGNYDTNGANNNPESSDSPNYINTQPDQRTQSTATQSASQLSMANKRKRNRSNIAAIDAASLPHGWEKISDAHYGVSLR